MECENYQWARILSGSVSADQVLGSRTGFGEGQGRVSVGWGIGSSRTLRHAAVWTCLCWVSAALPWAAGLVGVRSRPRRNVCRRYGSAWPRPTFPRQGLKGPPLQSGKWANGNLRCRFLGCNGLTVPDANAHVRGAGCPAVETPEQDTTLKIFAARWTGAGARLGGAVESNARAHHTHTRPYSELDHFICARILSRRRPAPVTRRSVPLHLARIQFVPVPPDGTVEVGTESEPRERRAAADADGWKPLQAT